MNGWPRVLVVGDVMRDIIVVPEGAMRRGSDVNASIRFVSGGSAANQAKWLAHQHVNVTLAARVGRGDGARLAAEFEHAGVDAILAEDPELFTGTLINLSEPGGDRSFFTDRGANQNFAVADVPDSTLVEADLLLLSGYMFFAEVGRGAALGLIERARARGIKIALDAASAGYIADVSVPAFLGWTAGIDLLFANAEEAALLSGAVEGDLQAQTLLSTYVQIVIKQGGQGAIGAGPDGAVHHSSAVAATSVDSTGAGDAFAAGYLSHLLRGSEQDDCLRAGNRAAAEAVGHVGGGPQPV